MQLIDWIVLAAFLLLFPGIAVYSAMSGRTLSDFYIGRRRFGKTLMAFFAFGSGTSQDQPGSVIAGAWRYGLAGLWWQFLWLPVTPFYWIAAPLLRRCRAITTADFFSVRYGPATAALYSIYGIAISVALMAGILFSSGRLLNSLSGELPQKVAVELNRYVPVINVQSAMQPPHEGRAPLITWKRISGVHLVVLGLAVLTIICGTVGGLGSSVLTDAVQGALTVLLTFILLPVVISHAGGFGVLHKSTHLKQGMMDFVASADAAGVADREPFTPFYLIMLSIAAIAGVIVQPHIIKICGAGRSELEARVGFTFGSLAKRVIAVAWTVIGIGLIVWYLGADSPLLTSGAPADAALSRDLRAAARGRADLAPQELARLDQVDATFADTIFARAAHELLPEISPGLVGLLMAMIVAAVVAQCGTQMIAASGLFTLNIYQFHIAADRPPSHYVWAGRVIGVGIVALAVVLQTGFEDVFDAMKLIIKTPAAIGISMWLGLIWPRWNTAATWATTICALVTWVLVAFFPDEVLRSIPSMKSIMFREVGGHVVMIDAWQIAWYLSIGLTGGLTAALLTDPEPADRMDHFYSLLRTPIYPNEPTDLSCAVPTESVEPEPAMTVGPLQLPMPTRVGVVGFVVAWVVVFLMIVGTKILSMAI
ncbi:MAG: hypothetical protein KDA96_05130 [Planctomycetaceae bacterium]|nr:hypothetical protein [Planctomycetaceae bacterium]